MKVGKLGMDCMQSCVICQTWTGVRSWDQVQWRVTKYREGFKQGPDVIWLVIQCFSLAGFSDGWQEREPDKGLVAETTSSNGDVENERTWRFSNPSRSWWGNTRYCEELTGRGTKEQSSLFVGAMGQVLGALGMVCVGYNPCSITD